MSCLVNKNVRSQGTFEYILLLGGVIILVLLVINQLISSAKVSSEKVSRTVNVAYEAFQRELNEQLSNLGA